MQDTADLPGGRRAALRFPYRAVSRYHLLVGVVLGLYGLAWLVTVILVWRERIEPVTFHQPWRWYGLCPLGAVLLPWALVETARYWSRRARDPGERPRVYVLSVVYACIVVLVAWNARETLQRYAEMEHLQLVRYFYRYQEGTVIAGSMEAERWNVGADERYIYGYYRPEATSEFCYVYIGYRPGLPENLDEQVAEWPAPEPPRELCVYTYGQWWRPVFEIGWAAVCLAAVVFVAVPLLSRAPAGRRGVTAAAVVAGVALVAALPTAFGYGHVAADGFILIRGVLYDFLSLVLVRPSWYPWVADVLLPPVAGYLGWMAFGDRFALYVKEQRRPIGMWELEGG